MKLFGTMLLLIGFGCVIWAAAQSVQFYQDPLYIFIIGISLLINGGVLTNVKANNKAQSTLPKL